MSDETILSKDAIREIIGRVAAQHLVVICDDDPAFFFATICAEVTERALSDASARLDRSSAQLTAAADRLARAAVGKIADETNKAVKAVQFERRDTMASTLAPAWPFLAIVAVLALILGYVAGAST